MMILVVALLIVLIAIGVPVAFAVIGSSIVYFLASGAPDTILVQRLTSGVTPFPLLAIPFFIFAGVVMANGGIAQRILGFADALIGHRRGGLAQVNVLNSVIMGGMTGSGSADAAVDAKVLVPIMTKFGYEKGFATALSVATGVIAPIIPPGIGLILYGYLADVSIGRLFVAGVIPGALLAVALGVAVSLVSRRRDYGAARDTRPPIGEIRHQARRAFWALMMPVLLLVGLRIGVFTPTELGAVAVLYSLVISLLVYREITWRDLPQMLRESVVATSVVVLIVAAGSAFGWIITTERVPQALVESAIGLSANPWVILLVLNLVLLVLGALIDATALLVILAPIMAPIGASLGVDPVHFGIVIVLNLTIGAITPPLGSILYTACAITGTSVEEYTRESVPFLFAVFIVLMVVTFVPAVSTTLPTLLYG